MWRRRCTEVLEVESENGEVVLFGHSHDRRVRESEVEIGIAGVDLYCPSQQRRGQEGNAVLAGGEGGEEEARGVPADA